jgi:hypothetical protein
MWTTRLSVRHSVASVTDYTIYCVFMQFGIQLLYKDVSYMHDFSENRLRVCHILLKSVKEMLDLQFTLHNPIAKVQYTRSSDNAAEQQ